jgi:DNA-binding transcriptional LysR family regulator
LEYNTLLYPMLNPQDLLRIFCAAAESANFRETATRLGLSPQGVTRAIQQLEQHYGELLFHRSTRSMQITEFGAQLVPRVRASLAQLEAVFTPTARRAEAELTGKVRVTAPRSLGRLLVLPALAALAVEHPGIVVDLRLSDELADVVDGQIDVGVRMGLLMDNRFVVRRIGQVAFGVYASPQLIERCGTPTEVAQMSGLPMSALLDRNTGRPWHWFFSNERSVLPEPGAWVTDDAEAELDAVLAGVAFGQLPDYLAQAHLHAGRLVRVLDADAPPPWGIYAYRPQRGPVPARVRHVFDAIVAAFVQT